MSSTAKQLASSGLSLPPDTYIYALARTPNHCAAISSDDSLRYFDPTNLSVVQTIPKAHQGITCLLNNFSKSGYVTAGRDGTVRCWDDRASRVGVELKDPRGAGLSALARHGTLIAAGTESTKEGLGDVSVLLWDTRNPSSPMRQYVESHTDTVTQISFHPSKSETIMSAATDGLVSIFDATIADEDDALVQVLNHRGAVHCAGFLTEQEVYAVSSDEQLSIYTLSQPSDPEDATLPTTMFGDVREQLNSSYVVDVFRSAPSLPTWIAAGDTNSSRLSLVPLQEKWAFDISGTVEMPGAHGEEVVRDILVDSHNQRFMTCGEDGNVRLWALQDQVQQGGGEPMDMGGEDGKSSKQRRKDKKKRGEKDRFNPY